MWVVVFASFAVLLLVGVYADEDAKSYEGDHVLNVERVAVENLLKSLVDNSEIEKWSGNLTHVQIYLPRQKVEEALRILKSQDAHFDVLTENLDEDLEEASKSTSLHVRTNRSPGHSMDWTSYHRLADIYEYMDYLSNAYPKIASVGSAGKTVEGRDLKYLIIRSGNPKAKRFWVDGGIHAREWAATSSATYVMKELVENRTKYASVVGNIDFYIMPVANPDGYEYSHTKQRLWRKNRRRSSFGCIGTDLNRNWGYKWGTNGVSHNPCDPQIYGGSRPFSEPETRATANLLLSIKNNLQAYVSLHTFGQYILIPYGFDNVSKPPDFNELKRVALKAAAAMKAIDGATYQVGHTPTLVGAAAGGSDDWTKGAVGVKYSYTFELRPTSYSSVGFALPASLIKKVGEEALAGVLAIAEEL